MKYTGLFCEYCSKEFDENEDVVVCPVCGTPQHRECWNENGCCVNEPKHESGFEWTMPDWKKKELAPAPAKKPETPEQAYAKSIKFRNDETATVCPGCGALNYSNDAFCRRCRRPLKEEPTQEQAGEEQLPQDMPGAPDAYFNASQAADSLIRFGGVSPELPIDGMPVGELSAYIGGKRPGRMIRRFMMMDRSGKNLSFNPAAFFFGPIWYFYRKLTGLGALFLVILTLLGIGSVAVSIDDATKAYYYETVQTAVSVYSGEITMDEARDRLEEAEIAFSESETDMWRTVLSAVLSIARFSVYFFMVAKSDYFYRKKICAEIEQIRMRNSNMEDYFSDLYASGGAKVSGAVIGVALAVIASFIEQLPIMMVMAQEFSKFIGG